MTDLVTTPGPLVTSVALRPGVEAWFTGTADRAEPPIGRAGNLSHHRPHVPLVLAADRAAVGERTGTDPQAWHLMDQVHGADVGVVDDETPAGFEHRGVDALVTTARDRVLAVAAADCVPIVLASDQAIGAVHAGRVGAAAGVVQAALEAMPGADVTAAVGPAIGGCCYEVPEAMRDEVDRVVPGSASTTTWGTPSLDVPAAVLALLDGHGVEAERVGGCTLCGRGWFSHRADPGAGRHLGLVVRR